MENNFELNERMQDSLEEILKDVRVIMHFKEQEQRKITNTEELISITKAGYEFDTLGIPFNAIIVGSKDDGETIKVNYKGLDFDVEIHAGVNQVNFINGMTLYNDKGIVVGLVRTQNEIK